MGKAPASPPHKTTMAQCHQCDYCGKTYDRDWQALQCCTAIQLYPCFRCDRLRRLDRSMRRGGECPGCGDTVCVVCCYGPRMGETLTDENICPWCVGVPLCPICAHRLPYESVIICNWCDHQQTKKKQRITRRALVCWTGRGKDPLPVDLVRLVLSFIL